MCTHLSRRGATYYFRRVIPEDVRPAFHNKTEWVHSLRTKDRDEAKRRSQDETVRTNILIGKARRAFRNAMPEVADELAQAIPSWGIEQEEYERQRDAARLERKRLRRPHRDHLRRRFDLDSQQLGEFERVARDLIEEKEAENAELRAKLSDQQLSLNNAPMVLSSTIRANDQTGISLADIVPIWAAERKPREKSRLEYAAVARWFTECIGVKPVSAICREDVLTFKDHMISQNQNPGNINVKLSRLHTLLNVGVERGYAQANVASRIKVKDPKAKQRKYRPFDLEALTSIFSSPVFLDDLRPIPAKGEAAYWIPLLALYSGARREEICQLRIEDIIQVSYADNDGNAHTSWFFRITDDDEDDLTLKNADSERMVPIHPELQRLGFLRHVESLRASGENRVFPTLKANKYGKLGPKWGEWFSVYLRKTCGVTDSRLVFHSFRHTFKHMARRCKIEDGLQRQLMGHEPGDVASEYGDGFDEFRVVEAMRQYRVPGFTSPPPPPALR